MSDLLWPLGCVIFGGAVTFVYPPHWSLWRSCTVSGALVFGIGLMILGLK